MSMAADHPECRYDCPGLIAFGVPIRSLHAVHSLDYILGADGTFATAWLIRYAGHTASR